MKVIIGADHKGYKLKEIVFEWLVDWGHLVDDLGAYEFIKKDDYTKYAQKVASMVANIPDSRGILLCGSGVGVDVVANKFDGIRASIGKSADQIKAGRNDDDMNILVIASDFTEENDVKDMVKVFLETKFSGKDRHKKRLEDIEKLEENN